MNAVKTISSSSIAGMKRRGTVLVMVTLLMTVLIGLAALTFDVGRLMVAKQRAQMICDSAALAGAQYLTGEPSSTRVDNTSGTPTALDGNAAKAAKYVALANNESNAYWHTLTYDASQPGITINFPPYPATTGTVTADNGDVVIVRLGEAIRARATIRVPLTFARIFGVETSDVHAESVAIVGVENQVPTPITVTANAFPWAVADTTIWDLSYNPPIPKIDLGARITMKITNPNDPAGFIGSGNFLAVAYEGDQGANDYRDRIASTEDVTFYLDQPINLETEPGDMAGPTEQGLIARLGNDIYPYPSANETAWQNWLNSYNAATGQRAATRRVGIVPIVRDPGGSLRGRSALELVGFAGMFLEGFENVEEGGNVYTRLIARFTGGIYTSSGITWLDPGTSPPYSSTVTSVRLLK